MNAPSRRGSRWLPWFGGLIAIIGMLILSVVLRVQETGSKAWPITRAVAARLATDEGARDLYRKNPELAGSYASADAFVEAVRANRAALGSLPAYEPGESRDSYEVHTDPLGFRAYIKASKGGWMMLEVARSDGSEAGHAAIGEGIVFLGFGDSLASVQMLRRAAREARAETRWNAFKALEQALLTEEGTRALLQANPDLAPGEAARAAFLQEAAAWRPRLMAAAPPGTWAEAPKGSLRLSRRRDPLMGTSEEIEWKVKDGAWLGAEWKNGRLTRIFLGN